MLAQPCCKTLGLASCSSTSSRLLSNTSVQQVVLHLVALWVLGLERVCQMFLMQLNRYILQSSRQLLHVVVPVTASFNERRWSAWLCDLYPVSTKISAPPRMLSQRPVMSFLYETQLFRWCLDHAVKLVEDHSKDFCKSHAFSTAVRQSVLQHLSSVGTA